MSHKIDHLTSNCDKIYKIRNSFVIYLKLKKSKNKFFQFHAQTRRSCNKIRNSFEIYLKLKKLKDKFFQFLKIFPNVIKLDSYEGNSSISHRFSRGSLERRRFTAAAAAAAAATTGRIRIDNWTVESRESRCEWPMSRCIAMASEYNGTISVGSVCSVGCHSVIQPTYGEIMGAVGFCAICLTYVTRPTTRRLQFRAINYFA